MLDLVETKNFEATGHFVDMRIIWLFCKSKYLFPVKFLIIWNGSIGSLPQNVQLWMLGMYFNTRSNMNSPMRIHVWSIPRVIAVNCSIWTKSFFIEKHYLCCKMFLVVTNIHQSLGQLYPSIKIIVWEFLNQVCLIRIILFKFQYFPYRTSTYIMVECQICCGSSGWFLKPLAMFCVITSFFAVAAIPVIYKVLSITVTLKRCNVVVIVERD